MKTSNKNFTVVIQLSDRSHRTIEVEAKNPTSARLKASQKVAPMKPIMTMVSENSSLSDFFPGGAA
jgi:hypothetical protein